MPVDHTHFTLNRRRVVLAGSALLGTAAFPGAGNATVAGLAPAADLLAATRKFLGGLEPDQRKAATFAWDGAEWRNWNYFGVAGYIKPGLRLEQMNATQKSAAWDLLATLFSPAGIEKTRNVMTLQDVLAASGNGTGQRSSERFSFATYGTPAETGAWGFRLEGHHLTQSIAVRDNRIIAVTPSSFSALPNRITSGKHAGLVTLKNEEALARRLAADLAGKPRVPARRAAALQHSLIRWTRARQRAEARHGSRRHGAASVTCCGNSSIRIRWNISRPRLPPLKRRGCVPAIPRRCISPGTARTPPRRRSAIG